MDPGSPVYRVERTFWAVWNYITGAVNRFLRPEPIDTERQEQNPLQAHAGIGQNVDSGHADADGQAVREGHPRDSSSTTHSTQPAVAQQLSNADDDAAPEEVDGELRGQFSENTEGHTTDNDAVLTISKVAGERSDEEPSANRQPQASENEICEMRSDSKIEIKRSGTDEERMRAMMPDGEQNVSETPKRIRVKEEIPRIDEKRLEKEDADMTRMPELSSGARRALDQDEAQMQIKVTDTGVGNIETVSNVEKEIRQPVSRDDRDIVSQATEANEGKGEVLQRDERDLESDDADATPYLTPEESDKRVEEPKLQSHDTDLETEGSETVSEARDEVEGRESVEQEFDGAKYTFTDISGMEKDERNNCIFEAAPNNQTTDMGEKEFQSDREKREDILIQPKETEDEAEDAKEASCDGDGMIEKTANEATAGEERSLQKDEVQTESFVCVEIPCSATVMPKGETEQETSVEFKNLPAGIHEAPALNSPTREEIQKGIPEYNNEPAPEENTTQWFLEAREHRETHVSQLPQEVESVENSTSEGVFSVAGEQENQECVTKELTDIVQHEDFLYSTEFEKQFFKLVEGSANSAEEGVATEPAVEERECDVTTTEPQQQQHENEGTLLSFETEERGSEVRNTAGPVVDSLVRFTDETFIIPEAEENRSPGTGFSREALDPESNITIRSGDTTESEVMKQLEDRDLKLTGDHFVEVTDLDKSSSDIEKPPDGETARNFEMCSFESPNLIAPNELLEAINQLSDKTPENRLTSLGSADDLETTTRKPEDLSLITLEEITKSEEEAEGSRSVIDEDIPDLCLDEALSKNLSFGEQEVDNVAGTLKEDGDVISSVQTEAGKEEFMESVLGEPGVVLETESSTANMSGLLEQSVNELDPEEPVLSVKSSTQQIIIKPQEVETEQTSKTSEELTVEMRFCEGPTDVFLTEDRNQESAAVDGNVLSKASAEIENSKTQNESGMSSSTSLLDQCWSEGDIHRGGIGLTDLSSSGSFQDSGDMLAPELSVELTNFALQEAASTNQCVTTEEASDAGASASDPDFGGECPKLEQEESRHEEVELAECEYDVGSSGAAVNGDDAQNEFTRPQGAPVTSRREGESLTASEDNKSTDYETVASSLERPNVTTRLQDNVDSSPEPNRFDYLEEPAPHSDLQIEVNEFALDFTAQRSRILVKNPSVRKPKDPRSLLQMPSLDPTPVSSSPVKIPVGVPLGGLGVGLKLPGLGAGLPVLKKTNVVKEKKNTEEAETNTEEKSHIPKPDEEQQTQQRPRWMPPTQPGFSNPLMSELKTKLRKPQKE
ncbi:uncharacterized protein LOC103382017 isoform X1 [Cynoglossus semilaevis]|uniref:uncharacterized protein LOC103382017 isoform X1 n=1 Tax=Cynoglossus semilaevis TaxID=244447 RepID=UPI000D6306D8|nr:uncharacterized protein LOC103382017 isoform X1 [Cynoglossus semilaevis]XP_024913250.1 uncharacterized protein LOC103382017 isoform X2 [Cynoglossus semilaevis]XP_024913252.1 uncharacterized protein LOC103382017 isoform X1 [Cynoglossus semilaevis]